MNDALLKVEGLDAWYADSHVLFGVALEVRQGQGVALLGRNGAGKSTLLKGVMDAGPRVAGRVELAGQPLAGLSTEKRARLGLMLVPEDRRIFPHLTVAQNLELAGHAAPRGVAPLSVKEICERFPMIASLTERQGYQLSGGQQQLVAVARGIVSRPRVMLLDEPAEGLAPLIVQELAEEVRRIREREGAALLLAEQNVSFARHCTDFVYLLDTGRVVFSGTWQAFDAQPELKTRYLAV
ncbi:MAG TPA: ABC transporter ATP-binding protein [Quisquiliibacterium sp.]|jgi:branched-chain amino acid transport system ATP-binding protein|nr:ABC transporter ATP-binding protein [Quisquiliibacterium sp.]